MRLISILTFGAHLISFFIIINLLPLGLALPLRDLSFGTHPLELADIMPLNSVDTAGFKSSGRRSPKDYLGGLIQVKRKNYCGHRLTETDFDGIRLDFLEATLAAHGGMTACHLSPTVRFLTFQSSGDYDNEYYLSESQVDG
ncbi:unnamed protein product [Protopolystoma xenopodis]|uniref:Uncharacterized protein n=1 Tax=Protopolystoma xenopodis TaxID=117903 RepID=A0A3S5BS11_9PLAT|nr:unnamed protein product [Protopolystoma xenopodis]